MTRVTLPHLSRKEWAAVQRLLNRFFSARRALGFRRIHVDGRPGPQTLRRIELARYYLGVGDWRRDDVTRQLIDLLWHPKSRMRGHDLKQHRARLRRAGRRQAARRRDLKRKRAGTIKGTSPGYPHWGGSRYVVEEAWVAAGKPYTSSTKRPRTHYLSRRNPASDHNEANRTAHAHDWPATGSRGDSLAVKAGRHFGVYRIGSYQSFYVRRGGRVYRCQLLWRVSGHYDHNHFGARA